MVTIKAALTPARIAYGTAIAAAIVSLALRGSLPVSAEGYLLHDDALFVRLAQSIASGAWLGPFDSLTLAKGAFYPLFVALAHMLSLPLPVAEQLVYLAATAAIALVLARASGSRNVAVALFVLLALDPWLFHPVLTRVIREALYMSLALGLVALAMLIMFAPSKRLTWQRAALLVGAGLVFAAYAFTREELEWLMPALMLIVVVGLLRSGVAFVRDAKAPGKHGLWALMNARSRSYAFGFIVQGAIFIAGVYALAGAFIAMNHLHYGTDLANEFRAGAFPRAYGALQRIEPREWSRYMMFDETVAAEAYEVSPAARELRPAFDGENGRMWRNIGCRALALDPCPKAYARGWFMWALRDAALLAGHYKSETDAQAYFARLAAEIDAACDGERIKCGPARTTMAPPFDARYVAPWLSSLGYSLAILAHMDGVEVGAVASKGRPDQIASFAKMVGPTAPGAPLILEGWVASRECVPMVSVMDEGGKATLARATYERADDIIAHFAKAGATVPATRFHITTDCKGETCRLAFSGCAPIESQKLDTIAPGWLTNTGEVLVRIDSKSNEASTAPVGAATLAYALMWTLGQIYRLLVPLLLLAGVAGTIVAAIAWRKLKEHAALATLAFASLTAILARAAVIAAFDVTSAYAVNPLYLAPAAPFTLVFGVVASYLGWRIIGAKLRRWSRTGSEEKKMATPNPPPVLMPVIAAPISSSGRPNSG
jgi:hypothetical protein